MKISGKKLCKMTFRRVATSRMTLSKMTIRTMTINRMLIIKMTISRVSVSRMTIRRLTLKECRRTELPLSQPSILILIVLLTVILKYVVLPNAVAPSKKLISPCSKFWFETKHFDFFFLFVLFLSFPIEFVSKNINSNGNLKLFLRIYYAHFLIKGNRSYNYLV